MNTQHIIDVCQYIMIIDVCALVILSPYTIARYKKRMREREQHYIDSIGRPENEQK